LNKEFYNNLIDLDKPVFKKIELDFVEKLKSLELKLKQSKQDQILIDENLYDLELKLVEERNERNKASLKHSKFLAKLEQ